MIWESSYWKQDLLRLSKKILELRHQIKWSERNTVSFEKDIFISFYSIRKLIEAKKLSRTILTRHIGAFSYPAKGKEVTWLNWHNLHELYDFDQQQEEPLDLEFLCNQVIHCYVFSPIFEEHGELAGILLASDRMKNKKLYEVSIDEVVKILMAIGQDYPNAGQFTFNEKTRDFDVELYSSKDAQNPVR
jgi:hypothetical protein